MSASGLSAAGQASDGLAGQEEPAAAACLNLVETGEASLDDRLGNYRAEIQLQAMIQESNNDSWSLIMDAVGHDELSAYAAGIGVDYQPETKTR